MKFEPNKIIKRIKAHPVIVSLVFIALVIVGIENFFSSIINLGELVGNIFGEKIEIIDVSYDDSTTSPYSTNIDFKILNGENETAYLTKAIINIKKVWLIEPIEKPLGGHQLPTYNYDIKIKYTKTPYEIVKNISQVVDANGVDRFNITLGNDSLFLKNPYCDIIFLADIQFVYNDDEILPVKEKIMFSLSSEPYRETVVKHSYLSQDKHLLDSDYFKERLLINIKILNEINSPEALKNERLKKLLSFFNSYVSN